MAIKELKKSKVLEFARQASIQEGDGYGDKDLGYNRVKATNDRDHRICS